MLTVRRGGPEDSAALALAGAATFLESYAEMIPGADILAHCARHHAQQSYEAMLAAGGRAWLAETAGGAAVGYALVTAPDLPQGGPDDLELRRIYVLAKWHGGGAARALADAALADARTTGHRRMLIGTYEGNSRAIAFYRKLGAERIGDRRFTVGASVFADHVYAVML